MLFNFFEKKMIIIFFFTLPGHDIGGNYIFKKINNFVKKNKKSYFLNTIQKNIFTL